jgi:hypothetical protein
MCFSLAAAGELFRSDFDGLVRMEFTRQIPVRRGKVKLESKTTGY